MTISSLSTVHGQRLPRTIAALFALAMLTGCIRSTSPILTDAQPLLGQTARFQHYDMRDGAAHDPETSTFHWDGTGYAGVTGKSNDPAKFTVFPLEGRDFIIQTFPTKKDAPVEYALAHKLADGVYLTFLIEERDADEATRAKFCVDVQRETCTIASREALIAFAKASAAKPRDKGGLTIRLPDEK